MSKSGMERRLHRSFTTLHNLGYLFHGKVGVVAEHDCQTLTGRQLAKCGHDCQVRRNPRSRVLTFGSRRESRGRTITTTLLSARLSYRNDKDPCRRPIKA
jgi:hypothetical protein